MFPLGQVHTGVPILFIDPLPYPILSFRGMLVKSTPCLEIDIIPLAHLAG